MQFYMTSNVIIDDNVLEKNKDLLLSFGKRCLIVTGKNSAKVCGALDDLLEIFKQNNIEYKVYDNIIQNPLMESCIEAGRIGHEFKADFVFGIGGGSVLDSTKVIAMVATNPELEEETIYNKEWKNQRLPILLLGLTAGTGSEVTSASVCTRKDGIKRSVSDPVLYADYSFGDPKYTMSLSREFTISTALDALAHSLESYLSNKANSISRAMSVGAIKLLWNNLEALKDENVILTLDQRRELYEASIIAGLAISMTMTSFGHGVGYYLTEEYHLPHGVACAVFMPDIFKHAEKIDKAYVDKFFNDIGHGKEEFLSLVETLMPEINIEMTEEEIDRVVPRWDDNKTVSNTLGGIDIKEIKEILMGLFVK